MELIRKQVGGVRPNSNGIFRVNYSGAVGFAKACIDGTFDVYQILKETTKAGEIIFKRITTNVEESSINFYAHFLSSYQN